MEFSEFWKDELSRRNVNNTTTQTERTPLIERANDNDENIKEPSFDIQSCIFRTWFPDLLLGLTICTLYSLMGFVHPLLLKALIQLVEVGNKSGETLWKGVAISLCFFGAFIIDSLLVNAMWYIYDLIHYELRNSLCAAIYKKALTIRTSDRSNTSTGQVVNLMQSDTEKIGSILNYGKVMITAPVEFGLGVYFLYAMLGSASLYGVVLLATVIPITYINQAILVKIINKKNEKKDERMKLINEILNGIKIVKMYGWEESFQTKVHDIRKQEVRFLEYGRALRAFLNFVFVTIPIMSTVLMFWMYIKHKPDHTLSPAVAFVTLQYIDMIKDAFFNVPDFISDLSDYRSSLKRVTNFLKKSDVDNDWSRHDNSKSMGHNSQLPPIRVNGTDFGWYNDKEPVLKDISFNVKHGELVAIVGRVGAGKSSFIAALTGELHHFKGDHQINGSVALVSQQAWIFNGTVRENILFGTEYNEERYNQVVESCALTTDFSVLAAGDNTKIGEQGINLSGGQKQRVSLARAVYNDADIYLLDDPLSAVDSHVGVHLFDHVIGPNGVLKNKTRIMVTHGTRWLSDVDNIYMLEHGRFIYNGTYHQLNNKYEFKQLLNAWKHDDDSDTENTEQTSDGDKSNLSTNKPEAGLNNQINELGEQDDAEMEESVETGQVSMKVYLAYLRSIGWISVFITAGCCVFTLLADLSQSIWLTFWTGDPTFQPNANTSSIERADKSQFYIDGYVAIGALLGLSAFLYIIAASFSFSFASRNIHGKLFDRIVHSKASFFDVRPVGMLLNRFGKDIDAVDSTISWNCLYAFYFCVEVIARVAGAGYGLPIMIPVFLVLGSLFFLFQHVYIRTARQLSRLASRATTPLYVQFTETLRGVQTIRAYKHQQRLVNNIEQIIDHRTSLEYNRGTCKRWLGIHMDIVTGLVVAGAALFSIMSFFIPSLSEQFNASKAGLVVTLLQGAAYNLHGITWRFSNLETCLISVERIDEYTQVEQEKEYDGLEPPDGWPSCGKIIFDDFSTRYRAGLNLVLERINLVIKPSEKIGIVGRTGAGKSSLTQSLFRLIEADSGCIEIDDININNVGLKHLRDKLTILPQDPLIFCGTVRGNLDPFSKYSDEEIWEALERSHLKQFLLSKDEKLDYRCGESGANLSVGQRQLMCLARALLRKNKILVLDEATAAVDMQTDKYVQETIRTSFKHCTILTIAHRLHTIMDSDRILVLDKGSVVELDTPNKLLEMEGGYFQSLCKEAGIVK